MAVISEGWISSPYEADAKSGSDTLQALCPLLNEAVFGTQVPYLRAKNSLVEQWTQRLKSVTARLRVGLVWAGNPTFGNDRHRSVALESLTPLAEANGVRFVSLQK